MSDRRQARPSTWTPDGKAAVIARVCDRIANGESLRTICADPWMPSRVSLLEWVRSAPELARQYRRAMEERTYMRSDRIDGYMRDLMAGKITPAAARVLFDTERWQMSKEHPKCFGPRVVVEPAACEHLTDEQIDSRINRLSLKISSTLGSALPVRPCARARIMGSYNG